MSKISYRVAPGVPTINGQRVPPSRVMALSPAEAMFDQAHGRLVPDLPEPPPPPPPRESDLAQVPDPIAAPVTRTRRPGRRP